MNEYYEILGLEKGASQADIKRAYFKLVRMYSPESDPEQFSKIREAYEQLNKADNTQEQPEFPKLSEPFAEKMYEQIVQCQKSGNNELFRDTCDEAWHRFPNDIQFLYLLVGAQRKCGNTGKAVKSAELLVSKEPDNKWFQRELAISYFDRGYTKKSCQTFAKAYEMGCRDMEFILMYSIVCDISKDYDKGTAVLLEVIRKKEKWTKDKIQDLIEIYVGLLVMYMNKKNIYFDEVIESLYQDIQKYSIYFSDYVKDLAGVLTKMTMVVEINLEEYHKLEKVFELLKKISNSKDEKRFVDIEKNESYFQCIAHDYRISDTIVHAFEVFYNMDTADEGVKRFAMTDVKLCMIKEREEILNQEEILKHDYSDFYEKMKDFIEKLKSEKNLIYLEKSLQKDYRRMEMNSYIGGHYYDKYPEERQKAYGKLVNEGAEDEPFVRVEKKIGRNDPCPCGSGKKYKRCCMNKN